MLFCCGNVPFAGRSSEAVVSGPGVVKSTWKLEMYTFCLLVLWLNLLGRTWLDTKCKQVSSAGLPPRLFCTLDVYQTDFGVSQGCFKF